MKTLKITKVLLLSLILCIGYACSDSNENDGSITPELSTPLPDLGTPQTAGSTVTITGTGFKEDCKVVLKEVAQNRATERVYFPAIISQSPTKISFIVPEGVDGNFNVIIKQDNQEYTIGKIALKSNLVGIWKWIKSTSGQETVEADEEYFQINSNGTGSYSADGNATDITWSIAEDKITIAYANEEKQIFTIKAINALSMKVEYQADGKTWEGILDKLSYAIIIRNQATTLEATDITLNEAVCKGQYTTSTDEITFGICYSKTNKKPEIETDSKAEASQADKEGKFEVKLSGLSNGTKYYYRAYLSRGKRVYYGEVKSFITSELKTVGYSKEGDKAICNGKYPDVKNTPSEYGICYSTSNETPTTADSKVLASDMNEKGEFTATIPDIKASKTYYFRTYVIIDKEVTYGEVKVINDFPVGAWRQTLMEITENGTYWKKERDFVFIYQEDGRIAMLVGSEVIVDLKSSYSYDKTTQILSSSYYDAEDDKINTETGKVTKTEDGFKLTIETEIEGGKHIAVTTYVAINLP